MVKKKKKEWRCRQIAANEEVEQRKVDCRFLFSEGFESHYQWFL
jgi:hypothetical protein